MGRLYKMQQRFFFRTPIRIKIPVEYPDLLFDDFFEECRRIDRKFNSHVKGSVTDRINLNAGEFVEADRETVSLFRQVYEWSEVTRGNFDMTIAPLLRLWGFYSGEPVDIPTEEEVQTVSALVDFRKVKIGDDSIKIDPGQEITTGGFLKGYAVDRVLEIMKQHGITDAVVNAGGSSIGCLNNEAHPEWQVIVNDPWEGVQAGVLSLNNGCCSTSSAVSQQVIFPEGTSGHILDCVTGRSATNLQCGILTPDCLSGDILSTAMIQLAAVDFLPSIKKLNACIPLQGYLVTADRQLIVSDNIAAAFNCLTV